MLFQRDFLEDSDSSYEAEEEEEELANSHNETHEKTDYSTIDYEPHNSHARSTSNTFQNYHQPTHYKDASFQLHTSPRPNVNSRPIVSSSRPYTGASIYQSSSPRQYGSSQNSVVSSQQRSLHKSFESENYDPHTQSSFHRPKEFQLQNPTQPQYQSEQVQRVPKNPSNSTYSDTRLQEESEFLRTRTHSVNGARPTSASAQMRMKMLEQQRNKLIQKKQNNTMQVTTNSNYKPPQDSTTLNSIIYSTDILAEQDLKANKELKSFAASNFKFEPSTFKMREAEKLPGPIKAERTVFKDDLEEEVLETPKLPQNPLTVTPRAFQPLKDLFTDKKELKQVIDLEESVPVAFTVPVVASIPIIPSHNPNSDFPSSRKSESTNLSISSPTAKRPVLNNKSYTPGEETENNLDHPVHSLIPKKPADRVSSSIPQTVVEIRGIQASPQRVPVVESQPANPGFITSHSSQQDQIPQLPPNQVIQILQYEMRDMKRFLTRPVPKGIMLQCSISRKKSGLSRIYPKYYMHTSENNTFLLAAKKRANNRTSNYLISMKKDALSVKSPYYMGKVRSNFMGTRFTMYDIGLNPKHKGANLMNSREELGVVYYVINISGIKYLWS